MNYRIQDLTLLNVLGKGSFGTVYLSKKDGKNCYFATKQIDRALADKPSFQKYFNNELQILKSLKHINIVHLEEVKYDNKNYYIVIWNILMEEVYQVVSKNTKVNIMVNHFLKK